MQELMTVVIPVGPRPAHRRWLKEAIESVKKQTVPPYILLIDDMQNLPMDALGVLSNWGLSKEFEGVHIWRSPWHLGVAHAFNFGVALAPTDLVLMLGADDTLEPECCEKAIAFIEQDPRDVRNRTYYGLSLRYMDTGEVQWAFCNAAVVTKAFWAITGGFPPESAVGAPDTMLLSMIWNDPHFRKVCIGADGNPLYNYRRHEDTDTAGRGPWQNIIFQTRDLLTREFQRPLWGRYE